MHASNVAYMKRVRVRSCPILLIIISANLKRCGAVRLLPRLMCVCVCIQVHVHGAGTDSQPSVCKTCAPV